MTNKERLISLLGFQPDQNSADGELLEKGIDGSDDYEPIENPDIAVKIRLCAINLMELLLTTPDQTNENGFVIKYDRKAVEARLKLLKADEGVTDDLVIQPKIRNKSFLW